MGVVVAVAVAVVVQGGLVVLGGRLAHVWQQGRGAAGGVIHPIEKSDLTPVNLPYK
ncbi:MULTISPECIES: hypothetical protein [Nocardiaceae]|uniref:hypothetical protein n=1 Tax=Nocardiaceae TaxID=85025 RepID=UPI000AABFF80|nr:hypothetical protein [Rhodococcus fascians]